MSGRSSGVAGKARSDRRGRCPGPRRTGTAPWPRRLAPASRPRTDAYRHVRAVGVFALDEARDLVRAVTENSGGGFAGCSYPLRSESGFIVPDQPRLRPLDQSLSGDVAGQGAAGPRRRRRPLADHRTRRSNFLRSERPGFRSLVLARRRGRSRARGAENVAPDFIDAERLCRRQVAARGRPHP